MGFTAGTVGFADLNNAGQEGPHLVSSRKADVKQRINGQLTLRYAERGLTSFAGLALIERFFRRAPGTGQGGRRAGVLFGLGLCPLGLTKDA